MQYSEHGVALPAPTSCDVCKSSNIFIRQKEVTSDRKRRWFWCCKECDAQVGCHPNTRLPTGLMASRQVRLLRAECHDVFDIMHQGEDALFTRNGAYCWLARKLDIDEDNCHIGWLTEAQLILAIAHVNNFKPNRLRKLAQRKERKLERQRDRADRQRARVYSRR